MNKTTYFSKKSNGFWFLTVVVFFLSLTGWGQLSLPAGGTYTQNFDGLPTLPTGWTVRSGASATALGTSLSLAANDANNSQWSSTSGNFRNAAAAESPSASGDNSATQFGRADRALAVRQTGGFGDPGAAFMLQLANTTGKTAFNLSLKHMVMDVQARTTIYTVQYTTVAAGTSGWTNLGTFATSGAWGSTTGSYSFGTALNNINNNVWIRVVALATATGSNNRDTYGIDDFVLTWSEASGPEINVQGNSTNILSGDTTPSTTDHTDFGSVNAASGSVVRTFTIQNTGTGTLTLDATPVVMLDGTHFTVTAQPSSTTVASAGSVTFQVTFDPSVNGALTDTVLIGSNDADEGVYAFDIAGFGIAPQPEIDVTGNAVSIVSGDVTPALADHTDFGSVGATNTIVRTYTIQNTGDAPLVLGSPAVLLDETDGFSVTQQPTSPVGVGSSTTFEITFTPSVAGVDTNTVLIDSNDANEGTYSFAITGTGTVDAPVATAATSVGTNSFTANWNAVDGATSYEIDVYEIVGSTPVAVDVVGWNFPNATDNNVADEGIAVNLSKTITTNATGVVTYSSVASSTTSAASVSGWDGTINTRYWQVSFETTNVSNLTLSSAQRSSNTGPSDFKIQYSLNGSTWTDIGTTVTVANNWTTGVLTNVALPVACENQSIVYLRWLVTSTVSVNNGTVAGTGTSAIDDILITGEEGGISTVYFLQNENVGNTTSYNFTGLNEGTTYYYVVRAISGSVETANSNEISVTTGYAPVTWTGGAWSNVSGPTNLIDAIIEDVYVTADDGEFTAKSLTVTTGGSLTVSSDDVVTVVGALENELTSSAVVVENNGVLMQSGTSNLNTGSITVRRNSSAILRQDYTLWSSPVAGQGLYAFSPTTLPNRFYTYNTSTNLYSNSVGFNLTGLQYPSPLVAPNGINGTDTNNVLFATAKGYLIRTPWNHPTAPTVFAGQFAGVPNSGDITYTMSLAGTGFNLVGNPYPSPISMETFVDDNAANITTSLYFWRETNGNTSNNAYCQWNDGLFQSNGQSQVFDPQNVIRTGQGFFVEAIGAGTALVFNNGQRVADTADQFFRQNNTQDVYWLNLTNAEGAFSQAVVSYKDYASNGLDRYDGKNIGTSQVSLTSLIDGQEYGIQGKATFVDTDVVPMHLKIEAAGNYSIAIDRSRGVFANGQSIYLKDNLLSSLHNLSQGAYSFTSEAGSFANRFEVVYRNAALGVDVPTLTEKQVVIYKNQVNDFVITTGNFEMGTVKVFDVRGRLLLEKQNINATQTTITAGLSNEVLLVQIATTDGTVVTKKVVR